MTQSLCVPHIPASMTGPVASGQQKIAVTCPEFMTVNDHLVMTNNNNITVKQSLSLFFSVVCS